MKFSLSLLVASLLLALVLPAAAPAVEPEPSCAAGPTTVGEVTYGTPCADVIVAPADVEKVEAGGGDDTIVAGPITAASDCPSGCQLGVGSQTFEGGAGDDVVYGERGNDILKGGLGNDHLFGGIGDDQLRGGPGDDQLAGGFGADSIDGDADDDYVRGDTTIDRIFDTGGGIDTLSYSTGVTPGFLGTGPTGFGSFPAEDGERGLRLDMRSGGQNANNGIAALGGGVDEVEAQSFEILVGTAFSDYLIGTTEQEAIYGGGGGDVIVGNGGGDTLDGGAGGDYVEGGTVTSRDTGKVSVGFMTPPGATPYAQIYLVGSAGGDSVSATYSSGGVSFHLSAGSFDQSASDAGGCTVSATDTDATCTLTQPLDSLLLAGMAGNDTITTSGFPASTGIVAIGGEGSDSITGRDGEDILVDGPDGGADTLTALGGDDALTHNGGPDQLLGGDGNDLFLSVSICDGEAIVGGSGRDNSSWARFTGGGVQANLEVGKAGRPGSGPTPDCSGGTLDSLQEIEDLEGSAGGDAFYGNGGPNQLLGHKGPDSYFAGAGSDSILANSGDLKTGEQDFDVAIDCGADVDSALVNRAEFGGDPVPVDCESVTEADPNNFRAVTQLPPPPPPEPEPEVPPQPDPPEPRKPRPPGDTSPPQTRLTARPSALLLSGRAGRRVAFRFSSSEAGSSFHCKLDRKPYRVCVSPRAYTVRAGRHAFRVVAVDRAGNVDPTPALFRFRVRIRR